MYHSLSGCAHGSLLVVDRMQVVAARILSRKVVTFRVGGEGSGTSSLVGLCVSTVLSGFISEPRAKKSGCLRCYRQCCKHTCIPTAPELMSFNSYIPL